MLHLLSVGTLVLASSLWSAWAPDVPRAQLESKYGADTQLRLQPGVQIHYKDTGPKDAPVVLLLHGFGSSLQTWDQWATKLETQYRVIRPDLPGFGLSGPRADRDYSEEADVVVLRQFLDALGIQQLAVIGHSMGGKMAWTLAAAEPERVTKLVLMAPDGYPDDKDIGSRPYAMPAAMGVIQYLLPKYFVRKSIEPAFANPQTLTDALIDRYDDMLKAPGVRGAILDRAQQTIYTDPVPRLKSIKAPTLLLWGEQDQMIPSGNAQRYASQLMNVRTVLIPQLGHVLQEEQPEKGLMEIKAFLKEQRR